MVNLLKSILRFFVGAVVLFIMIIPSDSPFDYPNSKWVSTDGSITITIDSTNNGKTHTGTLLYIYENIAWVYDIYEGHPFTVSLYHEGEFSRENYHNMLGGFQIFGGNKNSFWVAFSTPNENCPPTFGESPWPWQKYIHFNRVDE